MPKRTRRSPGEGSIYKRKDGLWVAQYKVEGKTKYIYRKTRKEVSAALAKAIADRDSGMVFDAGNITVGKYLDKWMDSIQDTLRERTVERHEMVVRVHLKPTIGHVKLDKLNALQIQDVYRGKLDSGQSARSVELMHATLYKALKQAVRWSLVPRNVADAVNPPRAAKREIEPLDKDQLKTLLDAARGDRMYPYYVLAVTTGMRTGEMLALKWSDIDLQAGTLKVNRTIRNGKVNAPKTNAGRRTIRLSQMTLKALQDHRKASARERISEWVFSTSKGTPMSTHNIHNRSWKPLLKRAGLPHSTRQHDLRHSCITLLLSQGVPVKVVSEMAGHSDVSITLSVYQHLLPDMQGMSAQAIDDTLAGEDEDEATDGHN